MHAAGRVPMMNWYSKEDMLQVQNALIGCSPRGGAWRPQDFSGFVSMLPDSVWDDLTNKSKDLNQKGGTVCKFLRLMGLVHPSEPTYSRIAGLMAVCLVGVQARDHDAGQMHDLYTHMKTMWKSSQRGAPPTIEHISELPTSPFVFQSQHPLSYERAFPEGHPPAMPRVNIVDVYACAAKVSMRRRAQSSTTQLQRGNSFSNGSEPNLQAVCGMFGNMMERMFQRFSQPTLDNGTLLTFGNGSAGSGSANASWATPGTLQSAMQAASEASTGLQTLETPRKEAMPILDCNAEFNRKVASAEKQPFVDVSEIVNDSLVPAPKVFKKNPDEAAQEVLDAIDTKRAEQAVKKNET